MADQTLVAPRAGEMAASKNAKETNDTLREFGTCAVALRNVLHRDSPLTKMEFLFMDSHFQVLQMFYFRRKRKHEI